MANVSKRPGTVLFVAMVLFVFGGYCLLNAGSTCGYAVHIAAHPEPPDPKAKVRFDDVEANLRFVAHEIPGHLATIVGFAVADILFSITLLGGGIGVLRLAPAARKATIVIVLAGLAYMLTHDVFSLLVVMPAEMRFLELHPPEMPQAGPQDLKLLTTIMQIGVYAGTFVTLLIQIFVVALVVWLLNKQTTKAAFGEGLPPVQPSGESPTAEPLKPPSLYTGYEDDETQPA